MKIPDFANCFDKVKRQLEKDSGLYHAIWENENLIKEFRFGKYFSFFSYDCITLYCDISFRWPKTNTDIKHM